MALVKTFKAELNDMGLLSVSDVTMYEEQFIGIKMMDSANLQNILAIFALNRAEAKALVMLLTEVLNKEVSSVH